jgi:hypothetical protein
LQVKHLIETEYHNNKSDAKEWVLRVVDQLGSYYSGICETSIHEAFNSRGRADTDIFDEQNFRG